MTIDRSHQTDLTHLSIVTVFVSRTRTFTR